MGDIGAVTAERLLMFDFQVTGWSRSRKDVPGVTSFAGPRRAGRISCRPAISWSACCR